MGELIKIDFPEFRIIQRAPGRTYHEDMVEFTVAMRAEVWRKYKKCKDLGWLYGVAISNEIHRNHPDVRAYRPVVSDTLRARSGIKTIRLMYPLLQQVTR